jgi:hypothetical protein
MNNSPPKKSASGYRFTDRLVLHSRAQTPAGFYIACEPYLTLPRDATAEEVGRAVQSVLNGFRADIPQPSNFKQNTADFIRGVGAKSQKKLQESSIFCSIREQDGKLEFIPYHNGGTSGDSQGFQPIAGAKILLASDSALNEIGIALFKSFALCTTIYEHF